MSILHSSNTYPTSTHSSEQHEIFQQICRKSTSTCPPVCLLHKLQSRIRVHTHSHNLTTARSQVVLEDSQLPCLPITLISPSSCNLSTYHLTICLLFKSCTFTYDYIQRFSSATDLDPDGQASRSSRPLADFAHALSILPGRSHHHATSRPCHGARPDQRRVRHAPPCIL